MAESRTLPTLDIHKLTKEQYDAAYESNELMPDAFYLTPYEDEVFFAERNITTFDTIKTSHDSGKIVICKTNESIATLSEITSIKATFSCVNGNVIKTCHVTSDGWGEFTNITVQTKVSGSAGQMVVIDDNIGSITGVDRIGIKGIGDGSEIFNDYETNQANGKYSHAEGYSTKANSDYSHAEGYATSAGAYSHAEGCGTDASAAYSHTEGVGTKTNTAYQHVQGKYNALDVGAIHIVGYGENNDNRSNIHTLSTDGDAWFKGNVYVGGTKKGEGSTMLQTVITGEQGQIVGFDQDHKATAQNLIHIGPAEPTPRNGAILWIDQDNGLKYWKDDEPVIGADGTTTYGAWVLVPVAFM